MIIQLGLQLINISCTYHFHFSAIPGFNASIWKLYFFMSLLHVVFFIFLPCLLVFLESQTYRYSLPIFSRSSETQYTAIRSPLSLLSKVGSFSFESLSSYLKFLRFTAILFAAFHILSIFLISFFSYVVTIQLMQIPTLDESSLQ